MESILNHFRQLNCPEFYNVCVKYFSTPINSNHSSKQTISEPNPAELLINDLIQIISTNRNVVNPNSPSSAQIEQLKNILLAEMKTSNDFFPIFNRSYDIDHYPIFKTAILAQMAINNKLTIIKSKSKPSGLPLTLSRKSQTSLHNSNSLARYLATKNIHIYIYKAIISLTLLLFNYKDKIFNDEEINLLKKDNFAALFYLLKYFDVFISDDDIQQYIANASSDQSIKKSYSASSNERVDVSDFYTILTTFLSFFKDNFRFFLVLKEKNSPYFSFFTSILTTIVQMMPKFVLSNNWDFYIVPISFYFSYFSSKQITFQKYDMLGQMYLEMCNQLKNSLDEKVPENVQTKILLLLSSVINNFDNEKNLMSIDDKMKICFESLSLFPKLTLIKNDVQSTMILSTSLINFINLIAAKYQTETDFKNIQLKDDNIKAASVYHDSHDAIINSEKPQKLQYMNPRDYFNSTLLIHFFTHQEAHPNPIVQEFVKLLKNFFTQSNYESDFILQALNLNFNTIKPAALHILLSALSGKFIKISEPVVDFITHLLQIKIYKVDSSKWSRSQIQLNDSVLFFLFGVLSKNKGILPIFTAISHLDFSILQHLLPLFRSLMMIDESIGFSKSFCQSHILDMIRFNITTIVMSNENTHQIMDEIVGFLQVIAISNPRSSFSEVSFTQLLKEFLKIDEYIDIILPCFKTGILTTDEKCIVNILNQSALIVIQATNDDSYISIANRLILLLSETINSLTKKSLKEYEDNRIYELISKFPSAAKNRESLVNSLKFFLNICLKFNSYIQLFSDLLIYQNLRESFTFVKLDSEMFLLLLSMTMNAVTNLEQIENRSIQNRFALKLLLSVIKDSDEELELLKYFHKICASSNSNLYECYQGDLISYLLERVDVPELQTEVFSLFKLICTRFCSPMILNKVHYTMISSKSKLTFMNIILEMIRDDSACPVSSFFAFSGLRTGIYGPSLDLSYLTTEWSFSTSINIEKVPLILLNLSEGSSSLLFSINSESMIECSRTEKKQIFYGKFKTPIESKKWTFLTLTITQREISLFINFENRETFPLLEKFTYNGPAVIKIAENFTGEMGKTYFFSTIDINQIKEEVLSNDIIKKNSICSYDPRGAYMGEIIDATSDNRCHLMGRAVPFTTTFRDIIQTEGIYQLFMTYFSIVDSEELFILGIQALTAIIGISDDNAKNFEKIGGFRLLVGLLSMINKKFFTIKVSQQLLNLFYSIKSENQKQHMFASYWMNLSFISTLNYEYQHHFYKEEFYNAYQHGGKITNDFAEALLCEIDRNFSENTKVNKNAKIIRSLQLNLLIKIINEVPKTIYRKLFQFQYIQQKNIDDEIHKKLFNLLIKNASSLVTANNNNNGEKESQNQLDLVNYILPFFLSKDNEIRLLALKLIAIILTSAHSQQISKEFIFKSMMFIKDDEAKLFNECFKIMFLYSHQQQTQALSNIFEKDILDKSIPTNSIVDLLLSSTSTCDCIEMTPILFMLSIFHTKSSEKENKDLINYDTEAHESVRDKVFNIMYHALPKLGRFYHDLASPLCLLIYSLNFSDNLDRFVEPFVVASFSNIQILDYIMPIFISFSKFSKTDVFKWRLHFFINLIQRSIESSLYIKEIATVAIKFMVYRFKSTETQNADIENIDQITTENDGEIYDDVLTRRFTEKDSIEFINYLANSSSSTTLDQAYIFEPCFVEDETFLELLFYLLYLLINDKKYEDNKSNIDLSLSSTMNYSVQNLRKIIASLILKNNPNSEVKYHLIEEFRNELNDNINMNLQTSHSQGNMNQQGLPIKKNDSHPLFKTKFIFRGLFKKAQLVDNDQEEANENIENEINENTNSEDNEANNEEIIPSSAEENYILNLIKEGELLGKNLLNTLKYDWQYLLDIKPIFANFRTEILASIFKIYNDYVESQQKKETDPNANYMDLLGSMPPFDSVGSNDELINDNDSNMEVYLKFYSNGILKSHKQFLKTVKRKTFMYQKYNQKLATTYLNESNEKLMDSSKKHWKISAKFDSLGRKLYFSINRNFNNHIDAANLRDSATHDHDENEGNSKKKKDEQIVTYKRILEINRSLTKYYKKDVDLSFEVMMVTVIGKYKGTIVVTDKMLLFEGTLKYESFTSRDNQDNKSNEKQKFVSIPLKQILFIFNRWTMHIDNSCEVFSLNRRSYFFIFPDNQTRRKFYCKINDIVGKNYKTFRSAYFFRECSHICNGVCQNSVSNSDLVLKTNLTKDWQARRISNFQYLFFLNIISGRSFNDLSQYPVYPWILNDYKSATIDLSDESVYRDLSVPIAAMNAERLKECLGHYAILDPLEKCLYRSHYSNPAFIIGYMIRLEPFTSLHIELQSGRFDYPDRLFYSVRKAWEGVVSTSNDYKELIPEFFTFPQIFTNENRFDLGYVQGKDNYKINDVEMPPWAKDPQEFVEINQRALESEYVRLHLNEWIDLIFGCYQKSLEKHTLYHLYSYHDCMKIPEIANDPINQQMAQHHSANFGCCPDKIFTALSPRYVHAVPKMLSGQIGNTNVTSQVATSLGNNGQNSSDDQISTQSLKGTTLEGAFNDPKNVVFFGKGIVLLKSGLVFNITRNFTQQFKISMLIQPNYKDVLYFSYHMSFVFLQRNGGFASCVAFNQEKQKETLKTITHKSSTIECMCPCGIGVFATGGSDCCINLWSVPNFTLTASIPIQSGSIVAMGADSTLEVIVAIDSQNMVYVSSINPIKHMLTFSLNMSVDVTKHQVIVLRTGLIAIVSDSADRTNFTVSFYDLRGIFVRKMDFDGSVTKFFSLYPSHGENFVVILVAPKRRLIVIDLSTFDVVSSSFKGHVYNNFLCPVDDRRAILYLKNASEMAMYEF